MYVCYRAVHSSTVRINKWMNEWMNIRVNSGKSRWPVDRLLAWPTLWRRPRSWLSRTQRSTWLFCRRDRLVDDFSINSTWLIFDRLHRLHRSTTRSTLAALSPQASRYLSGVSGHFGVVRSPRLWCEREGQRLQSCMRRKFNSKPSWAVHHWPYNQGGPNANVYVSLHSYIPVFAPVTLTLTRWPWSWYTHLT